MADTNEYYVQERPNPYALNHTVIFEWLTGGGAGVSGIGGPTGPFLANGELLRRALGELSGMVAALEADYRADSVDLARQAITRVSDHVGALAEQTTRIATGFDGYVEAYQQARARVPEPLPGADRIDAVQERSPGLLAQVPGLAQLEEEHNARTRAAQEEYGKLDRAAVAADDATPRFPLMLDPVVTREVDADLARSAGGAGRASGSAPVVVAAGPSGHGAQPTGTPPASLPQVPPSTAPTPAPTPGAGAALPPPLPLSPGPVGRGAVGVPGPGPSPSSPDGGRSSRLGTAGGRAAYSDHHARYNKLGDAGDTARPRAAAPEPVGRRTAAVPLQPDTGTARTTGGAGRATPAGHAGTHQGAGFGPAGARREDDRERARPSYLEELDPHAVFGADDVRVAPAVIGEHAPGETDNR